MKLSSLPGAGLSGPCTLSMLLHNFQHTGKVYTTVRVNETSAAEEDTYDGDSMVGDHY